MEEMQPSLEVNASFFQSKSFLLSAKSPALHPPEPGFPLRKAPVSIFLSPGSSVFNKVNVTEMGCLISFCLKDPVVVLQNVERLFSVREAAFLSSNFSFYLPMCESGICEVDSRSLSFLYRTESVYISSEVGCYQCIARYGHRTEYGCSGGVFPDDFSGSFVNAVYASVRCAYIYGFSCQCRAGFYGSRSRAAVWCGVDQGIAYRTIPFLFQCFVIQCHKSFVCRAKDDFLVGE